MKDATRENPAKTTHTDLKRKMEVRHLRMISLGGVIGTGLFLSSGYTINQADPLGTVIAYAIGAVIVYLSCSASASFPSPCRKPAHSMCIRPNSSVLEQASPSRSCIG